MRKLLRVTRLIFVYLFLLLLVGLGGVFMLRVHRQHVTAEQLAILTSNGIDEAMYVKIGGIDQWIQIRGQDRDNPVLLCLHGGPGATWLPLTAVFAPWEKDFTVVQWDQRGAGKSLEASGSSIASTMSIQRMSDDGIELAEFLRAHLKKEKILLLGHSWGSILGVHMVLQRPDLFYAYVGTGQVAQMTRSQQISYDHLLEKARAASDKSSVQALVEIGPPPFDRMQKVAVYFHQLEPYEVEPDRYAQSGLMGGAIFNAPNFSLRDILNRARGFERIPTWSLYQAMLSTDLSSLGSTFKVPVFFFQGAQDEVTEASLVQEYFDKVDAPHKEIVLFEGEGHFAVLTQPGKFLKELDTRVRPLAVQR
jgi:pimeloyl-ACP methyl ester carboxylesterase